MNFSAPSSMLSTSEKETETLEVQDQTNYVFLGWSISIPDPITKKLLRIWSTWTLGKSYWNL